MMKTTPQKVTPEQAAKWMHPSINRENRPLRDTQVAYLEREISEGRWKTTHQGIAFAIDGRLLDGQHRLAAIIRADTAVTINVTTGLDADTFNAMDCGLKRANYDRIHLVDDQQQNKLICQAIRTLIAELNSRNEISVGEIEDEFLDKTDAWVWVGEETAGLNARLRKAGILAAFGIYRFVKPQMAQIFMDGYRDGAELTVGSPVLKLRNYALAGSARDCSYWRVQAIMRSHLQGKMIERNVYEAAEDMMGHENRSRSIKERSESRTKAAIAAQAKKRSDKVA